MISYAPDVLGNTTQITYPSGDVVSRSFDPVGRLGSVMGFTGGVNTFDYDLNGTLDSAVLGNGVAVDYQSDRNGRVTSVGYSKSGATLGTFGVGRDVAGRVTSDASTLEAARTFGYDPQGRLESVSGAAAAFRFDAAGNVDRMSDNKTFTYTSANRLDKKSALGVEVQSYAFDGRGNRLSKTTTSGGAVEAYTYDAANRLKGVTGQSGYTYDGTGLRSKSVIWTAPIEFVWDRASYGLPELAQATAGTTATMYAYGPGGIPLEQKVNDGTTTSVHWFGHDQLGSTRLLTDTAGAVAATYTYAPYGQVAVKTGAASTRFQFAGEYTDPIAGFQYLRARTYDPATGQFLTRDPMSAMTREAYGYVEQDPVNRLDPSGLTGCETERWSTCSYPMTLPDPASITYTPRPAPPRGPGNGAPLNGGVPAEQNLFVNGDLSTAQTAVYVGFNLCLFGGCVSVGLVGANPYITRSFGTPGGSVSLGIADVCSFEGPGAAVSGTYFVGGEVSTSSGGINVGSPGVSGGTTHTWVFLDDEVQCVC